MATIKSKNDPRRTFEYIFVHTTAADFEKIPDQFFPVNRWHKERWGEYCKSTLGYYGGYTMLISNGKEFRYREDWEETCAATGYNMNALHLAIGFDGDIQMPKPQDVKLVRERIKKWQQKYNIPIDKVHIAPHRSVAPHKTCYGSLLPDTWALNLIKEIRKDEEDQTKKDATEQQRQVFIDKIRELKLQLIILLGKYITALNKRQK